jgi:hypothetical protein
VISLIAHRDRRGQGRDTCGATGATTTVNTHTTPNARTEPRTNHGEPAWNEPHTAIHRDTNVDTEKSGPPVSGERDAGYMTYYRVVGTGYPLVQGGSWVVQGVPGLMKLAVSVDIDTDIRAQGRASEGALRRSAASTLTARPEPRRDKW